jgi:hypothetical protein
MVVLVVVAAQLPAVVWSAHWRRLEWAEPLSPPNQRTRTNTHPPRSTMLYCALTGQLIAKSLDAVKLHMKGKRFQRARGEPRVLEADGDVLPSAESHVGGSPPRSTLLPHLDPTPVNPSRPFPTQPNPTQPNQSQSARALHV